jgi:hypothetical protein
MVNQAMANSVVVTAPIFLMTATTGDGRSCSVGRWVVHGKLGWCFENVLVDAASS